MGKAFKALHQRSKNKNKKLVFIALPLILQCTVRTERVYHPPSIPEMRKRSPYYHALFPFFSLDPRRGKQHFRGSAAPQPGTQEGLEKTRGGWPKDLV